MSGFTPRDTLDARRSQRRLQPPWCIAPGACAVGGLSRHVIQRWLSAGSGDYNSHGALRLGHAQSAAGRSGMMAARQLIRWVTGAARVPFNSPAQVLGAAASSHRDFSAFVPPPAMYGGRHTVAMIPGDGIGPELMLHVRDVFRCACVPIDFEVVDVHPSLDNKAGIEGALTAIRRNRVALKGNIETNHNMPPSHKSSNNLLRTSLDLYANVIHCQSLTGVQTRHEGIDILIIRENTEGEYSNLEHESVTGVVESLKIITKRSSMRIAEYAFELARAKGRRKVTAVHKANIMKLADGLFLQCCKEVAGRYPDIKFDSMIVDNTTMQLVSNPQQFDVMVMPNLYGNVVSNVCAGLVGGPGLAPGANYGKDYAVFETGTRNTGKSIANKNIANPTAMLLASCLMLDHLKLHNFASLIRNAVMVTMNEHRLHTPDIGGMGTTLDVVQAITRLIQNGGSRPVPV
ncbi:isocitrate dehydrogenase [NAD] subunit gamma, mitochondrial isoform X2 [Heterodontus francisci]|uniref:isocitrate dehydrogenase [NAD] subunit gamma, mitochondrial isoform X2 n=1 Tax=Heterodontus francisci TaxID=7792 RepID=UPI00355BE9C5